MEEKFKIFWRSLKNFLHLYICETVYAIWTWMWLCSVCVADSRLCSRWSEAWWRSKSANYIHSSLVHHSVCLSNVCWRIRAVDPFQRFSTWLDGTNYSHISRSVWNKLITRLLMKGERILARIPANAFLIRTHLKILLEVNWMSRRLKKRPAITENKAKTCMLKNVVWDICFTVGSSTLLLIARLINRSD